MNTDVCQAPVAKLVAVSLMVRVLVPADASEEEIFRISKPKFVSTLYKGGLDNLESIEDDTECPYVEGEEVPRPGFKNTQRRVIGYQITSNDNKNDIPRGLYSFIILSESAADTWLKRNASTGSYKWKKIPVYDGDIEDPVYLKYL